MNMEQTHLPVFIVPVIGAIAEEPLEEALMNRAQFTAANPNSVSSGLSLVEVS